MPDSKSKKKKSDAGSDKSKSKSKEKSPSKAPSKAPSKKDVKPKKADKTKKLDDQSDVSSIIPTAPPSADCIHHKNPFIYYCETCEELVCNQCTVYGPHNNHLHRILKITDAYRSRVFYLSEAIRTNLVEKRDKIIAQLHRLEYRSEEIKFVKNIISRDIRSEYAGILERLKHVEGVKMANISHEVSLVQREVETINDIGNTFFELTSLECDQLEQERRICKFLLKSKQMYEATEYLLNKPDRPILDIKTDQLPREVEDMRRQLQKASAAKQINEFKNEVIYNLSLELKEQEKRIRQEVEEKADSVIRQLNEEAQQLNKKLSSYKLICCFCGVRMSPNIVNDACDGNKDKQSAKIAHPTEKSPSDSYLGNSRHFFSRKPSQ